MKNRFGPLAYVVVTAVLVAGIAAQSPARTGNGGVAHRETATGIVRMINATEADVEIKDEKGENPRTVIFQLTEKTQRGDAKMGDTVTITYVEENTQKIARVIETAVGGLSAPIVKQRDLGGSAEVGPAPVLFPDQKPVRKVAVLSFDYASVMSSSAAVFGKNVDVGKELSGLLVTKLESDGTYLVVDRNAISKVLKEQNFSNADRMDIASAANIGKLLGVDEVIVGDIIDFGPDNSRGSGGGGAFWGISKLPHRKTIVDVTARLIDVNSAMVVASATGRGESPWTGTYSGPGPTDLSSAKFGETDIGKSVNLAVNDLAWQLEGKPMVPNEKQAAALSGLVADFSGDSVVINIGLIAGVHVGDTLEVLQRATVAEDPASGKVLSPREERVGKLIVTKVAPDSATGKFIGTGSPKVGDSVRAPEK